MKKFLILSLCMLLTLSLCACGKTNTPVSTSAPDNGETDAGSSGTLSGVPNPMVSCTLEDLSAEFIDLSALSAYEDVSCAKINGSTPVAQVKFTADGDEYTYRVALPAEKQDISGMYFTWSTETTAAVGYNTADLCLTEDGQGVISWYDYAPGVMYSLSMSENATAEKLTALANAIYVPVQGDADGEEQGETDLYAEFAALVQEVHESYFPGTSGSSLVGAACAARMADLFTVHPDYAPVLADMVAEFGFDSLQDASEKEEFAQQIAGLDSLFQSLITDGIDVLDGADYQPTQYPWDGEALTPLFRQMADSVSLLRYASMQPASAPGAFALILDNAYAAVTGTLDTESMEDYGSSIYYLMKDCTAEQVGYRYLDLDGDGSLELMLAYIGEDNDFMNSLVFGVYRLDESDAPAAVFTSRERDRYYYAGESRFAHVGSSGADDSFDTTVVYQDGALTDLGTVTEAYVTPEMIPLSILGEMNVISLS